MRPAIPCHPFLPLREDERLISLLANLAFLQIFDGIYTHIGLPTQRQKKKATLSSRRQTRSQRGPSTDPERQALYDPSWYQWLIDTSTRNKRTRDNITYIQRAEHIGGSTWNNLWPRLTDISSLKCQSLKNCFKQSRSSCSIDVFRTSTQRYTRFSRRTIHDDACFQRPGNKTEKRGASYNISPND